MNQGCLVRLGSVGVARKLDVLDNKLKSGLESLSVVKEKPRVRALGLNLQPVICAQTIHERHVNWAVWTHILKPGGIELACEVSAECVEELIVRSCWLLATAVEKANLMWLVTSLSVVVFRNLFDLVYVILLLKKLLHEVFILERFVIETLSEVLPKLILEFIYIRAFLVDKELQLISECFLK